VTAGVIVFSLFAISPVQKLSEFFASPHAYSGQVIAQFEPVLEQARQAGIEPGDKVWIIAQHTTGFEYWVLRYSLMENQTNSDSWSLGTKADENDVWTVEKSASEWMEELAEYDYVAVLKSTDSFVEHFGELFVNPEKEIGGAVFSVESINGQVRLRSLN
jgi:hypothetical protein